ncbi:unnamed protein product, partial [Prorocentrum cordatum]
ARELAKLFIEVAAAQEQRVHFEARAAAPAAGGAKSPDVTSLRMINALRRKLNKRAAPWAPVGRTLKLQGIKVPDDDGFKVLAERADMIEALRDHWAPIFHVKPQVADWQRLSLKCMEDVALATAMGRAPPVDWNDSLLAFPPKGPMEEDTVDGALRAPSAARAIALKSSGCKLVAAASDASIEAAVESASPAPQRGILSGRNFLDNMALLDAMARPAGTQGSALAKPLLALFDSGGLLRALLSLYWLPAAFVLLAKEMVHFACVTCGIAQASGVCADDVGCAFKSRRLLLGLWAAFEAARALAGVQLEFHRCILIPLDAEFSDAALCGLRARHLGHLPAWSGMSIPGKAGHLGFVIGPGARGADVWRKAAAKRFAPAMGLAPCGAPPPLAARLCNRRVLPVLGYLQQLVAAPASLRAKEAWAFAKIQALACRDVLSVVSWPPCLRLRSMAATGAASSMRAARATVADCKHLRGWLAKQASEHGALQAIGEQNLSPTIGAPSRSCRGSP